MGRVIKYKTFFLQQFTDGDGLEADASLIAGRGGEPGHNGYYSADPFHGSSENPYKDTTESDSHLRHIPLSEVIPAPWRSYRQIEVCFVLFSLSLS